MVDVPALHPQELADLPIAIATILLGQSYEGEAQIVLVLSPDLIAESAPRYPKNLARPSLGRS
jgi:hypothetical protein